MALGEDKYIQTYIQAGLEVKIPDLHKPVSYGLWPHCRDLNTSTSEADLGLRV